MLKTQQKKLTENELVLELEKLGLKGINKRTIGGWRRKGLLPDFDIVGRGRGKGLGKSESAWANSEQVIEQSHWVCRMRSQGVGSGDLYPYLWMLDYPIQLEDIRYWLLEPITREIQTYKAKCQDFQEKWKLGEQDVAVMEDVINDEAIKALHEIQGTPLEKIALPQELMEAAANIIFNQKYELDEFSFAEGFVALENWQKKTVKIEADLFESEGLETKDLGKEIQTIFDLLNNADFIQEHFSIHKIEKSLKECSDEDLSEVQNDLRVLGKILKIFISSIRQIIPHMELSADSSAEFDQFLPWLFKYAEIFTLANISLRHSGYSLLLNQLREHIADRVEKEFTQQLQDEIEISAPLIGKAISETFELTERLLLKLYEEETPSDE